MIYIIVFLGLMGFAQSFYDVVKSPKLHNFIFMYLWGFVLMFSIKLMMGE